MAYDEELANRIRERLQFIPNVIEKKMMGGLTFMVNDKMCVGVLKDEMLCRIDPNLHNESVEKNGCRTMDFTKRPMSGFVLIDQDSLRKTDEFNYWIELSLAYNPFAKSSKLKKT